MKVSRKMRQTVRAVTVVVVQMAAIGCGGAKGGYDAGPGPCDGVDCSGHGSCAVISETTAACACDQGFHAEDISCVADPAVIPKRTDLWSAISAGTLFTCAIAEDSSLWCWGSNDTMQLGIETIPGRPPRTPRRVGSDTDWVQVSAGDTTACALKKSGSLWCWGNQLLSNGESVSRPPAQVGAETDWVQVSAGNTMACARKENASIWCWGNGRGYVLGNGADEPVFVPTHVAALDRWEDVRTGENGSCGLQHAGSLWCWGRFSLCENDDTLPADAHEPRVIRGVVGWKSLSVGGAHVCMIGVDGSLWCRGNEAIGFDQGMAVPACNDLPKQIGTDTDWAAVGLGERFTCAVKKDGSLWCWGELPGRLSVEPVRVGTDGDWATVSSGAVHACAMKKDKTLWCWGDNVLQGLGFDDVSSYPVVEPGKVVR